MSTRAEILELGYEIAETGVPSRCVGCDKPGRIGGNLAALVLRGVIDRAEAVITLRNDLDTNCPSGLGRLNDVDLGDDRKCGYLSESNEIVN